MIFRNNPGVGSTHVAEMPWLTGNSCQALLSLRVTFDKTKLRGFAPKFFINSRIWKAGAYKINLFCAGGNINGKPGFMLAASGRRNELISVPGTMLPFAALPNVDLFFMRAEAADKGDFLEPMNGVKEPMQRPGGIGFHKNVRVIRVGRQKPCGIRCLPGRMLPVDKLKIKIF